MIADAFDYGIYTRVADCKAFASDRLKYPYSHHTSDRLSTNEQHQTAIAPNLNQKAIA
jgi:hypothetical protein